MFIEPLEQIEAVTLLLDRSSASADPGTGWANRPVGTACLDRPLAGSQTRSSLPSRPSRSAPAIGEHDVARQIMDSAVPSAYCTHSARAMRRPDSTSPVVELENGNIVSGADRDAGLDERQVRQLCLARVGNRSENHAPLSPCCCQIQLGRDQLANAAGRAGANARKKRLRAPAGRPA